MKKLLVSTALLIALLLTIHISSRQSTHISTSEIKQLQPHTIEWIDLLPKDAVKLMQQIAVIDHSNLSKFELDKDKNAKRNPSNSIGKNFGTITQLTPNNVENPQQLTLKDVLISTGVRREYINKKIRIAGYVVPLEYNDNHELTAFFFAPYYGACTHVPPPAPNQLIYAKSPQGIKITQIFDPFWLTGVLHIETTETEETVLGISSYSVDAESLMLYENDEAPKIR